MIVGIGVGVIVGDGIGVGEGSGVGDGIGVDVGGGVGVGVGSGDAHAVIRSASAHRTVAPIIVKRREGKCFVLLYIISDYDTRWLTVWFWKLSGYLRVLRFAILAISTSIAKFRSIWPVFTCTSTSSN